MYPKFYQHQINYTNMRKILILIAVLLVSCEKENPFEKNLTTDSQDTFWARKAEDSLGNFNYFGIQMIFNKDKSYEVFYSDNEDIKGNFGNANLGLKKGKTKNRDWDFHESDSLFFMFPDMYKVNRYSKDTIYMNLITGNSNQFIMIRKKIK